MRPAIINTLNDERQVKYGRQIGITGRINRCTQAEHTTIADADTNGNSCSIVMATRIQYLCFYTIFHATPCEFSHSHRSHTVIFHVSPQQFV